MNDIVAAAVAEFLDKGYENASMEAIATRAGLTKGGLYHHFASKDEVLGYANLRLTEPVDTMVLQATRSTSAFVGVRDYIRRYIRFWAAHPRELTFFFLTLTKAFGMSEMRQLYAGYYRRLQTTFTDLFARAISEGTLKPHDPAARALGLLAALDGAISYLAFEPTAETEARLIRQLEEVFLNDIADRTPEAPSSARHKRGRPVGHA